MTKGVIKCLGCGQPIVVADGEHFRVITTTDGETMYSEYKCPKCLKEEAEASDD